MRYYVIDYLRALAIVNMIIYHALFDIVFIFGINLNWFTGIWSFFWEQYICFSFILIAGFCQGFAKSSLREGIIVSLCGIVISLVSIIINLGVEIYFGVLTFIGLAILVTIPLKKFLNKINSYTGLVTTLIFFLLTRNFMYGYVGFGSLNFIKIPEIFYRDNPGWILTLLGFPFKGFTSADYFPFLPWYFLFLIGYFLFFILKRNKLLGYLKGKNIPLITWISSHSLLIYMFHQPIVFLILFLIFH